MCQLWYGGHDDMWPTFFAEVRLLSLFLCMKQRYVTLQMLAIHVFMIRKQDGIVEKNECYSL